MTFKRKAAMLKAFASFSARISNQYARVAILLHQDKYVEAQQLLAEISVSHAKTSMSLRNVLVREGLLPSEEK